MLAPDHAAVSADVDSVQAWARATDVRLHERTWNAAADRILRAVREHPGDPAHAAMHLATNQGFVLTTRQLRRLGVTDSRERVEVRADRWSRPRAGVVCVLPNELGHTPEISACASALLHPGSIVSHTSAAHLDGLPVIGAQERPVLTRRHRGDAGGRSDVLLHACRCAPEDVGLWHGVLRTTVARTVVDVARANGPRAGVVIADAALRAMVVTSAELHAAAESAAGRPGVRAARHIVDMADGRSESPLESLVRLCLVDEGFGHVEPQLWIDLGRQRARVDLALVEEGVIIEADGAVKYRDEDVDVMWNERLRHEALNRLGWEIVRVTWDEVWNDPMSVIVRIRAAIRRQHRSRSLAG